MSKVTWKGSALLAPLPAVLVTSRHAGKDNVFTVAWAGITNTQPPKCSISIRPERLSYEMIRESREFVINIPTSYMVRAVDYCGCVSGKKTDKFAAAKLATCEATQVNCLQIEGCPLTLECRVTDIVPMGGTHDLFLADIVAVNVEEKALDETGKLRMDKCSLLAYAHGDYFALGKKVGTFGFSVKKKHKSPSRRNNKKLK